MEGFLRGVRVLALGFLFLFSFSFFFPGWKYHRLAVSTVDSVFGLGFGFKTLTTNTGHVPQN